MTSLVGLDAEFRTKGTVAANPTWLFLLAPTTALCSLGFKFPPLQGGRCWPVKSGQRAGKVPAGPLLVVLSSLKVKVPGLSPALTSMHIPVLWDVFSSQHLCLFSSTYLPPSHLFQDQLLIWGLFSFYLWQLQTQVHRICHFNTKSWNIQISHWNILKYLVSL